MNTSELDFELPEALIAQEPAAERDEARLLVVDRADESIRHSTFADIGTYLRPGDCLVVNDTRVIRARLHGRKTTGGRVEIFLLRERDGAWEGLVRPSAKTKPGARVLLPNGLEATVGERLDDGRRLVTFNRPNVVEELEHAGIIPLPPYIRRSAADDRDAERYQTVYAAASGAVAAPTAGLHYTPKLLEELEAAGISSCALTLHVGYGTFKPVTSDRLEDHRVDAEEYVVSEEAAARLNETRARGGRIVAVGTTSTRVLETVFHDDRFVPGQGETELYILPGHRFQAVDVLQTNFHLPRSSLLALVAAFAGRDLVLHAYRTAVQEGYRFYSYGDTTLFL